MPHSATANILNILETDFSAIVEEWLGTQVREGVKRADLFSDSESRSQNAELLKSFAKGIRTGVVDAEFNLDDLIEEEPLLAYLVRVVYSNDVCENHACEVHSCWAFERSRSTTRRGMSTSERSRDYLNIFLILLP